jgi:hypothetical protein
MKQQIVRIAPHQAGKVLGIMYFLISLLIVPFMLIGALFGSEKAGMAIVAIALPFVYGVLGYLFSALAAAIYNLIAGFVGGLEITVEGDGLSLK